MKVSIIIPVYNTEKYLRECINSALNQTYSEIEIIAVNDGSTDSSLNILKEYDKKISIIDKKNGGTASALNAGIRKMTGEWFKWISSDDYLEKNAVEELINGAKVVGNESKNLIFYGNQDFIDEDGKIIGEYVEPDRSNLTNFEQGVTLLNNHFGSAITSLIHKSVFTKCGLFNEKVGYYEDYEFWLRCVLLFNYKLFSIPKKIVKYRIHSHSISSTKLVYRFEKKREIRELILNQLTKEKRKNYLQALKDYKKTQPLSIRMKSYFRDFLFNYLPKGVFYTILKLYMRIKSKYVLSN